MARHSPIPCGEVLGLHDLHESFSSFTDFQPRLETLLQRGKQLKECAAVIARVGILEPYTEAHIPPDQIRIAGPNYRESLVANGLLSRNRAILRVTEKSVGSIDALRQKRILLPEAFTGLALWLQRLLEPTPIEGHAKEEAGREPSPVCCQSMSSLDGNQEAFDLIICSEVLEHSYALDRAFQDLQRVLKPGGKLLATFPMAFGHRCSVEQVGRRDSPQPAGEPGGSSGQGDRPVPEEATPPFRIPGWDVLDQARACGFTNTVMHGIASWKHGILGGDLACVLVMEAQR